MATDKYSSLLKSGQLLPKPLFANTNVVSTQAGEVFTNVSGSSKTATLPKALPGQGVFYFLCNAPVSPIVAQPQAADSIRGNGAGVAVTNNIAGQLLELFCSYAGTWEIITGGVSSGLASPLTTKGDIWGWTTTNARIPVGADGTVLTADSTQALGVKWAAAGGSSPWTFTATDRMVGQGAGASQSGQRVFLAGANAGASSTVSDLIVIGSGAGAAGIGTAIQNIGSPGTIAIGSGAAAALTGSILNAGVGPSIFIGRNAMAVSAAAADCVIIGDNAFAAMQGTNNVGGPNQNTVIGSRIMTAMATSAGGPVQGNVIIGDRIGNSGPSAGTAQITGSVIIGSGTALHADGWTNPCVGNVLIGGNVMDQTLQTPQANVIIGTQAFNACSGSPSNNIAIGYQAAQGPIAAPTYCTTIGAQATATGQNRSTYIGALISHAAVGGLTRATLIGAGAGSTVVGINDMFLVETYDGTLRTLIFGRHDLGNISFGNTSANRADLNSGTNIVKLTNGTVAGTPTGGGYFYVSAGALHWKGSAGTDTVVAPA